MKAANLICSNAGSPKVLTFATIPSLGRVSEFLRRNQVRSVVVADGILGCPQRAQSCSAIVPDDVGYRPVYPCTGVRRRAELLYQQLDGLLVLRHTARGELLAESRKHSAVKILRQIPSIGQLRAAMLLALMQTPYRFRSKRQLWTYIGLAVETHDSAQHRYVDGQLQRSKKSQQIRGLNQNHNHDMKNIFKSTALSASRRAGPLQDFYEGLLAKGMKPEMARLTLARKIAAITLTLWKKGGRFDAEFLKSQAA
jgi:hypothetical protein